MGREVLVSGNFFNLDPHYLPLADEVDLIITEMRNTTYRQPEWYRYVDAFAAADKDVIVVENPYGGVVPGAGGRRWPSGAGTTCCGSACTRPRPSAPT